MTRSARAPRTVGSSLRTRVRANLQLREPLEGDRDFVEMRTEHGPRVFIARRVLVDAESLTRNNVPDETGALLMGATFTDGRQPFTIVTDIIIPLADLLKSGDYELKPVLKKLFESEHFFAADDPTNSHRIGGLIKSPLDTSFEALSFFNVTLPDAVTANVAHYQQFFNQGVYLRMLGMAGFNLFQPSDVSGYPGYGVAPEYSRAWFNSSTIIARYRLPDMLLNGKRTIGSSPNTTIAIKLDIVAWVKTSGIVGDPSDADGLVRTLISYLFAESVEDDRVLYFRDTIFLNGLPAGDWTYEWSKYKASGVATEVNLWLTRLFKALLYSQEYQLF